MSASPFITLLLTEAAVSDDIASNTIHLNAATIEAVLPVTETTEASVVVTQRGSYAVLGTPTMVKEAIEATLRASEVIISYDETVPHLKTVLSDEEVAAQQLQDYFDQLAAKAGAHAKTFVGAVGTLTERLAKAAR